MKLLFIPALALIFTTFLQVNSFAQVTSVGASASTGAAGSTGITGSTGTTGSVTTIPDPNKVPKGSKTALIVIDMQAKFVTRGGNDKTPENQEKVKKILDTQIAAIKAAKKAGIPVILIAYEKYGEIDDVLLNETKDYQKTAVFLKSTDGIFEDRNPHKKEVVDYLDKEEIRNLIVTGANGGACVYRSITGALHDNYNVVAYTDAIADFNYKEFIYPYVHQYDQLKPDCTDCTFKEVTQLDGVLPANTPVKVIKVVRKSTKNKPKRNPAAKKTATKPGDCGVSTLPASVTKMKKFSEDAVQLLKDEQ